MSVPTAPGPAWLGDSTLVAWYRCLHAPRAGGAYDSHHRTAGIAGCTRRCGGGVAARGAGAAVGNAGDRIPQRRIAGGVCALRSRVSPRIEGSRLRRGAERDDRTPPLPIFTSQTASATPHFRGAPGAVCGHPLEKPMATLNQHIMSRRGFCLCCMAATTVAATGGWLSPRQAFAEARNIVDLIRDDAAKSPIKVHK